jgi:hypothetical protein
MARLEKRLGEFQSLCDDFDAPGLSRGLSPKIRTMTDAIGSALNLIAAKRPDGVPAGVAAAYAAAVGPALSARCRTLSLSKGRLSVLADHPAYRMEAMRMSRAALAAIAKAVPGAVSSIDVALADGRRAAA